MRKTPIVISLILVITCFALATSLVQAGTATTASVWTEDSAGNKVNFFNPGQTVYIYWNVGPSDGTVDIYIVNTAGATIVTIGTNLGPGAQPQTWTPTAPGYYYVVAKGAVEYYYPIAVASIFILPESAFGTIMATTAGFAAFGTIAIVKRKYTKNKKQ